MFQGGRYSEAPGLPLVIQYSVSVVDAPDASIRLPASKNKKKKR